jgi:hypothetical protein
MARNAGDTTIAESQRYEAHSTHSRTPDGDTYRYRDDPVIVRKINRDCLSHRVKMLIAILY